MRGTLTLLVLAVAIAVGLWYWLAPADSPVVTQPGTAETRSWRHTHDR